MFVDDNDRLAVNNAEPALYRDPCGPKIVFLDDNSHFLSNIVEFLVYLIRFHEHSILKTAKCVAILLEL